MLSFSDQRQRSSAHCFQGDLGGRLHFNPTKETDGSDALIGDQARM